MHAQRFCQPYDRTYCLADGLRINLDLEGYDPVMAGSAEEGLLTTFTAKAGQTYTLVPARHD